MRENKKKFFEFSRIIFGLPNQIYFKISVFVACACLVLSVFLVPSFLFSPPAYNEGDVVEETIKARRTYKDIIDEVRTQEKRAEAEANARAVYDYNDNLYQDMGQRILEAFKIVREKSVVSNKDAMDAKVFFENKSGVKVSDPLFHFLRVMKFNDALGTRLSEVLKKFDQDMVVASIETLPKKPIVIRNIKNNAESPLNELDKIKLIKDIQNNIEWNRDQYFEGYRLSVREEFTKFIQSMVAANLSFNPEKSELKHKQASESVKPIVIQLLKGDSIVSRGETINNKHLLILNTLRQQRQKERMVQLILSIAFILFILIHVLFAYSYEFFGMRHMSAKDFGVLVLLLISATGFTKVSLFVVDALRDHFQNIPESAYQFAIPIGVTAMLVRLLMNGRVALMFSLALAITFGFILEQNFLYSIYVFIGSLVAVMGVSQVKARTDLYKAGFKIGIVNALTVTAILAMKSTEPIFNLTEIPYDVIGAFISGPFSAVIVSALVPLFEVVFNYTTDLKLLELANLNHPLLRRLSLETPGTFNHSILVGTLCDAAAVDIGANPLAARVGAYYHDVGKVIKPSYYIENQMSAGNPHDEINPRMSSLIITSHVKEGLELADEYKLGQPVKDAIEQHHGKTVIRYFYQKALEKNDPAMGEVDPNDYRYPGPKPQTREVALVMLADACEAASRVIEKPNPERIQAACEKVIFGFFQDGQLDENELTLKDLNLIIQCFTRVLMGVYHQRIKYPEAKKDENQYSKEEVDKKDPNDKGKKVLTALGTRAIDRKRN